MKVIPLSLLSSACWPKLCVVASLWPRGIPVTLASVQLARRHNLGAVWITRLLPPLLRRRCSKRLRRATSDCMNATVRAQNRRFNALARWQTARQESVIYRRYRKAVNAAERRYNRTVAELLVKAFRRLPEPTDTRQR